MTTDNSDNAYDRIFQELYQATVELTRRRITLRKLITDQIETINDEFIAELEKESLLMEQSWDSLQDLHLNILELLTDEKLIEEEYIRYDDQKLMTIDIRKRVAAWIKIQKSESSSTSLHPAEENDFSYGEALQENNFNTIPSDPPILHRYYEPPQPAATLQEILSNQMKCMERMLAGQQQNAMILTLPKPEIQIFNGEPLEYHPFIKSFENLVEGKTDNYSSKLHYLVQYTTGNVQKLVKGCLTMEPREGYLEARRLLKVRFGDEYAIATATVEKLTKYQQLRPEDGEGLQHFADQLTTCRNTLKEIGYLSKIQNPDNLQAIIGKLPFDIRKRWRVKADYITMYEQREVTLHDITDYVEREARIANHPVFGTIQTQKPKSDTHGSSNFKSKMNKSSFSTQVSTEDKDRRKPSCAFCKKNHFISDCQEFLDKGLDDRRKFVADANLCFNCLIYGHRAKLCRKNTNCETCKGRHAKILHQPEELASRFVATPRSSKIALPILAVQVKIKGCSMVNTYALLDCGSNGTFCTDRLLQMLNISGKSTKLRLTTLDKEKNEVDSCSVDLEVYSLDGSSFVELNNVYSRPSLPFTANDIPKQEDIDKWSYLNGIKFPSINSGVDLIIGLDHRSILEPKEVISSKNNGPYAVKTILGWVINGPLGTKDTRSDKTCNFIKSDVQLSQQFQQFCNMEFNDSIDDTRLEMSRDDTKALEVYNQSIELTDTGHYQVALPLKTDPPCLPNCRPMAEHRFNLLKKRFFKDPDLYLRYEEIMQDLLNNKYAEIVPDDEVERTDGMLWYLPHHPVFHAKKPDKLRVVFDCSAKYHGICLNDMILKGPDMTSNLVGVLTRFRQGSYAIMGDIQSMFHQVNVIPNQRDLFRFLWWPKNDQNKNPVDHRMKVHLFGSTSSPSICNYTLRRTAEEQRENYAEDIVNSVKKNFYVDDYLKSTNSELDASRIIKEVTDLLANGGFRITKWSSNSRNVIASVPEAERVSSLKNLNFDELPIERALGLLWSTDADCFTFLISIKDKPVTRRGILSILSSVYDPLGFVAPVILKAKIILQDLTRLKLGWDDQVPEEYKSSWLTWLEQLPHLSSLQIPRCFKPSEFGKIKSTQLHHFADSSEQAYSAATYLRLVDTNGRIFCTFVFGKSRVAPLKTLSIPRLELSAATVSIRLNNIVSRELEFEVDEVYFWTDSTTVLKYINNNDKRFNTFVANRITTILDGSSRSQWKYVDTTQNVADTGTRTITVKSFLKDVRWLSGPEFLWKNQDEWPEQPDEFILQDGDPEIRITKSFLIVNEEESFINKFVKRFSSWQKLKRCTSWILRYKQKLKDKINKRNGIHQNRNYSKNLSLNEIKEAEFVILKLIQKEAFFEEYKCLKKNPTDGVNRKSSILKLDPILEDDIIRVGGRLRRRNESYDSKHQIILPKKHHLTDLIIMHYHESVAHSGREYCLSLIRRKFWPINANSTVRRVLSDCIKCKKRTAPVCNQKMADLPIERVSDNLPPFSYLGIDCFGPFNVKRGRSQVKRYGCIFTCLSSRAVHLEVLCSMDTDSFINSLRRFISRRGCPMKIRTDNGGNFVSGDREIRNSIQEWNKQQIDNFMTQKEIEWSFNPPAGSHFGGIWERCIRSVRKVLGFLLNEQTLCDESLNTLFCEVEMILNGRPITTVSEDPKDLEALTPNHILLLRCGSKYPPGAFNERDCYVRRRWRHVQYLANVFWRRWTREYLPILQTRQKWNNTKRNLKIGDVILFEDKDRPRGAWPLARVTNVFEDDNGLVRVVELKTRTQVLKRPVDKIVLLEGVED